jgi:hypothetical protein
MSRAIACLLLFLGITAAGCAADHAEHYRRAHPGWSPSPPRAGDSLEETLASLQTRPEGPVEVSVEELRVMRVDVEPWEVLSLDSAPAAGEAHEIGLVAHRRCKGRRGIRFFGTERVAWYVFVAGELVAYDTFEFGEACEPINHYLPSRAERLATERALIRYAAPRYPKSTPTVEELLGKGLALVSAGRLRDAKGMLRKADREIHWLSTEGETSSEEEREALEERVKKLKATRAKLSRAITDAEQREKAGRESPQGSGR